MRAQHLKARRFSATRWFWGPEAVERSAAALVALPQPVLLVGEAHLMAPLRRRLIEAWVQAGLELRIETFPRGAECCRERMEALVRRGRGAGSLCGLGGGKCLDAVKWAAWQLGLPCATVPTSPATCACATDVVVEHSPQGEVLDLLELPAPPVLCVADEEILRSAPLRLFSAGLGDTLAKWLEWSAVETPEGPAAEAARRAYGVALQDGPRALEGDRQAQESCLLACLRWSAEASVEGGAPAAAAHSFCAGLSLLPRSRAWLHGEWAALGLEFQAALLGQASLASELKKLRLPSRLPFALDSAELRLVRDRILAPGESIHGLGRVDPKDVEQVLLSLMP